MEFCCDSKEVIYSYIQALNILYLRPVKKALIITAVVITLIGGYLLYNHFYQRASAKPWDLVPAETVLVYENGNCKSCVQEMRSSPIATLISRAAFTSDDDSISSIHNLLLSFEQPTLVSLHNTKKDAFDFTFYLTKSSSFDQKFKLTLEPLTSRKGAKRSQRELNGIMINEIQNGKRSFAWIDVDNILVASFSPILIEDVIRAHSDKNARFNQEISSVYQLPRMKNDGGNLYIHLQNLTRWFSLFTSETPGNILSQFGHSALLDSKISSGSLVLNGFSAPAGIDSNPMFLSAFQDQSPVSFNLKNVISNRAILVSTYGLSNGTHFFKKLAASIKNPYADSLQVIMKEMNFNPVTLFENFSGEIAECYLEGRNESFVKMLIIQDKNDIGRWKQFLNKVSELAKTDTVFYEPYSSYDIQELPVYKFPEKLFYPMVTGFATSYYAQVGDAICISENIEELKRFLNDIDQENTWGKSVSQNKFLESTLLESNVSVFVNAPKAWTVLANNLQPKWKSFIEENKSLLNSLGMGAIQFSHLNDTYYTNVYWSLRESKEKREEPRDRYVTVFDARVSNFSVTRSHVDRSPEVLLQDTAKNLVLLSEQGKILWKLPMEDYIQGGVEQIDFFNNGKWQYYFATPGLLHVVDRLGKYVKPYPVEIPEKRIEFLSLIDYDHSKKYRFLLASHDGKLWMYDKDGTNLEGWQPRSAGEGLAAAPNHHRILGKDYILSVRRDGVVYLMNRRGEMIKNFPLDLNVRISGDYFLDIGKNQSATTFTVVSVDGFKIRFNLQGKIVSREVLVKNVPEAKFSLIAEKDRKSYVIIRQEPKQFSVFNESSDVVVTSDYIGNNPVEIDYHTFGNGLTYVVVTDKSQSLSFIFDMKGNMITPIPLDSDHIEVFPDESGKLRVISSFENNVSFGFAP